MRRRRGNINLYLTGICVTVYHKKRILTLGVRETEMHTTVGRCHLCCDAVVKLHLIVVWTSYFVIMAELGSTVVLIHHEFANLWHERIDSVIANPRRTLVALAKAANLVMGIEIFKSFTVDISLWRPLMHTVRHRRGRECVAMT